MDFEQVDWRKYVVTIEFCADHVTIRDERFPRTAVNPKGEGRYHKPGQPTYYLGSGGQVAQAETPTVEHRKLLHMRPGSYDLVDLLAAGVDYPELADKLVQPRESGGWEFGQALRNFLESLSISGHIAPSAQVPGEQNVILYRLDHKEEEPGFLTEEWDGNG